MAVRGVDRTTKQIFLNCVEKGDRETLIPLIETNIEKGSTIYSDSWAPYFILGEIGYNHGMVNYSKEFVSDRGVCTNTIESLWGELKADLKIRRGFNQEQVEGYLDEFMYRREFKDHDVFEILLQHVSELYGVNDFDE